MTRTDVPGGVTPTVGDDLLVTLQFIRGPASIDTNVTFTEATLQGPGDPNPLPIPVDAWFGGRLDAN